jgi:monoamine oxidase
MARTPLLRKLQALYWDFAEAERTGKPVERIQDERRKRTWTRRDFIKATGATMGAAAFSGPIAAFAGGPPPRSGPAPRIAIVGGGIAGLNAALTLQDAGYASTVYEASNRVGGRMHSDSPLTNPNGTSSWANGQVSEHCGELIDTGHKTIQQLAKRFGFGLTDLLAAEPIQSTDTYWFFGAYYPTSQANSDFKAVYNQVHSDAQAAGFPTLYNSYTARGNQLDHMSLYDYIETYVAGGHSSPMGRLLDVAYNTEYGGDSTVQSALNLVYLLAYQAQPGQFRIFGASDERYHVTGGNEQVPRAIANALPTASVQLNTALTGIVLNTDGTFALSLKRASGTFTAVADRVIMAIPFSVLRTILTSSRAYGQAGFDSLKQTAITQLGYGTNSKLHLQFTKRLWNTSGPWGISTGYSFSDDGYQNSWDVSRGQGNLQTDPGILVNYTGGSVGLMFNDPTQVQVYAKRFLSQVEPVFPGITALWNGRATVDYPTGDPYALGSYSFWKVGQYTQFSGYEKARQPYPNGKCHFAGEHCSINFQGYMEGGAQEGARAANEILSDYKAGVFP